MIPDWERTLHVTSTCFLKPSNLQFVFLWYVSSVWQHWREEQKVHLKIWKCVIAWFKQDFFSFSKGYSICDCKYSSIYVFVIEADCQVVIGFSFSFNQWQPFAFSPKTSFRFRSKWHTGSLSTRIKSDQSSFIRLIHLCANELNNKKLFY